jgi:hypothetical protein
MDKDLQLDRKKRNAGRLSPIVSVPELHPWRRAEELTRCFLYWMPARSFPLTGSERVWLIDFLARFVDAASAQLQLRTESFLQAKVAAGMLQAFTQTASRFSPIVGWSRRPGTSSQPMPSQQGFKELLKSGEKLDAAEFIQTRCYWFLKKAGKEQRQTFLGQGGMTMLLLGNDPDTKPPELPFTDAVRKDSAYGGQISQLEALLTSAYGMKDRFLAKSKQVFGKGLEEEPAYRGISFVLPELHAADFFNRPTEECESWFEVFDIYLRESPEDQGIILASKIDLDGMLTGLLKQMNDDGIVYLES